MPIIKPSIDRFVNALHRIAGVVSIVRAVLWVIELVFDDNWHHPEV
jgi:succinate dehydrogenase/fumarate reductase cytochrome b subunit